jgi:methionyl aminopeptidase
MDENNIEVEDIEELQEEREKLTIEAGKIANRIKSEIKIKPGDSIVEICERLEKRIKEEGADFAFPVNVSINEIAAHDTGSVNDERTIGEKDVVKIDIGIHKNGFIADGAFTLDFSGEHGKMMDANKEALENVVSKIRAGINTSEIGKEIEETAIKYGFKTIENLTGHGLERYSIHSSPSIPNRHIIKGIELKEGDIIAIEPFFTMRDKAGYVTEMDRTEIFSAYSFESTRSKDARKLMELIVKERKTLPFAERHYAKTASNRIALIELIRNGSLITYPVLREKTKGIVTQFEHTVIVRKDSCEVVF